MNDLVNEDNLRFSHQFNQAPSQQIQTTFAIQNQEQMYSSISKRDLDNALVKEDALDSSNRRIYSTRVFWILLAMTGLLVSCIFMTNFMLEQSDSIHQQEIVNQRPSLTRFAQQIDIPETIERTEPINVEKTSTVDKRNTTNSTIGNTQVNNHSKPPQSKYKNITLQLSGQKTFQVDLSCNGQIKRKSVVNNTVTFTKVPYSDCKVSFKPSGLTVLKSSRNGKIRCNVGSIVTCR